MDELWSAAKITELEDNIDCLRLELDIERKNNINSNQMFLDLLKEIWDDTSAMLMLNEKTAKKFKTMAMSWGWD